MSRLLRHRLPGLTSRGPNSGSSSSRVCIEFPHCFLCLLGQFGLALCPFISIVLTALEAGGICQLAWCQWRSWAWRVECEFLHILGSDISVVPPFPCPSPLNLLNAHLALIFILLRGCAVSSINAIRDLKSSHDRRLLSSLLWLLTICHFLELRNLSNGILRKSMQLFFEECCK